VAYLLSNICTKKYCNRTTIVESIVAGWVVSFFRDTVYITTPCSRYLINSSDGYHVTWTFLNKYFNNTTTTTILRPFFLDHPGEPVPEENVWTFWCKGRLTEAATDHPAGCHSIRTNQCSPPPSPIFLQAGCPSCRPTNSVKALKDLS